MLPYSLGRARAPLYNLSTVAYLFAAENSFEFGVCRVCCRVYFIARDVVVDRSLSRGRARTDSHAKSLLTCVVCKETAPEIGRDASDRVCTVHRGSRFRTATGRSAVWCAGRARGGARGIWDHWRDQRRQTHTCDPAGRARGLDHTSHSRRRAPARWRNRSSARVYSLQSFSLWYQTPYRTLHACMRES